MNMSIPTENDLHAYSDGQLDEERQRQVESYLAANPDAARVVDQIRLETQRLRSTHQNLAQFTAPAHLDPARIRRELRARSRRRMAMAAMLVMGISVGGWGGWQAREGSLRADYVPMADAVQAYRLFASSDATPVVDLASTQPTELQAWLNRHFVQPEPIPDFNAFGFQPVGGRLVPSEYGTAAMIIYKNAQGHSIIYYVRPPGNVVNFGNGDRKEGNLLTQYWKQGRYFYAVVSPTDTGSTRAVQQAVEPNI